MIVCIFKTTKLRVFQSIQIIVFTLFLMNSCSKNEKYSASYESTIEYVQDNYKASKMTPNSSTIDRVEYYVSSPKKWLIVYFKSNKRRGYIYQNFPESKWKSWQRAKSKGKWYAQNLKGNKKYFFCSD